MIVERRQRSRSRGPRKEAEFDGFPSGLFLQNRQHISHPQQNQAQGGRNNRYPGPQHVQSRILAVWIFYTKSWKSGSPRPRRRESSTTFLEKESPCRWTMTVQCPTICASHTKSSRTPTACLSRSSYGKKSFLSASYSTPRSTRRRARACARS